MKMRLIVVILVISLLLSLNFIITGCTDRQEALEPSSVSKPSDEEVLTQYPDDLDAALEELEKIE